MARVVKSGFDYTRLDVNFWGDLKIRRARKRNPMAPYVYLRIVTLVLQEGYYLKEVDDLAFIIGEDLGMDEDSVNECIDILLAVELIDTRLFRDKGVITSRGIQKQYNSICDSTRKRGYVTEESEYSLLGENISENETVTQTAGNCGEIAGEMREKSELIPQTAGNCGIKKRKENRREENYYSSLSSFADGAANSEEEQKQQIISFFFFERNFLRPQAEYEKLVSWNTATGNDWSKMDFKRRFACAEQWVQQDENKKPLVAAKRFTQEFLSVWLALCRSGTSGGVPLEDFLSDGISFKPERIGCEEKWLLRIPESVYTWTAGNRQLVVDSFRPLIGNRQLAVKKLET